MSNISSIVYFITGSSSSHLYFDRFKNAAKNSGIETNSFLRFGNITTQSEFNSYNHYNPTFAVIDHATTSKKAIKQIAEHQLHSALDQLLIKCLVYYPTIILIANSEHVLDKDFSEYKDIMIVTDSYDKATNEIKQIVQSRTKK